MGKRTVWIVGATASLGKVLCHEHAKSGDTLILSGRSEKELRELACDLEIRYGQTVATIVMDFSDAAMDSDDVLSRVTNVDVMYLLVGDMGTQDVEDLAMVERVLTVNFLRPAQWITAVASYFKRQGSGVIVVAGSVAGDRGRASNYVYGSAKGALALFADGLRGYLSHTPVHVVTCKLGFVDTPLTYGKASALVARRSYVVKKMMRAVERKKNCLYIPFFWRYIMWVIKLIPEQLFKYWKI